jgi:uncharacterized protein (DUF983 family)
MRLLTILKRAARLRCVRCGEGKVFAGLFRMHPRCASCGLKFEREPGFFLGAIYINYGVTALTVTAAYLVGFFAAGIRPQTLLWSLTAFCVLFPLWFFRYARSFWIGWDELVDSRATETANETSRH